ncbi:MAG: pyruvate carboxylase [Actinomycetota bacterium]|nr:pyruvate carboxylase [Actinomycetota bacterium]
MFEKVLVANRGEIAVRVCRALKDLGVRSVAVYCWEDRNGVHRWTADEAYLIGERGHPVRAHLDVDRIVRVARECGADAVHPGYGFLSESPELARACRDAGIAVIGPGAEVLAVAGDKVRALAAAREAAVPVLASSAPSRDVEELVEAVRRIGTPVFVKAVAGGGGRGMRRVDDVEGAAAALRAAMREAEGAFGNPTMFVERAVARPRHIEVQILADGTGEVVHLFERDCSVQRRHQKVVEVAPAPGLAPALRERLCADAVALARKIGYVNAGTVEFLLATDGPRAGEHVFIEMNPRIQVEHTVTEEVTGVDLVSAQIRIAAGQTLADLGLIQETIRLRGAAVQCRVTTENPADGFRPDSGVISGYWSPGGAGIRLDGGNVHTGAVVDPHFDSLLVKLVAHGADLSAAVIRARRALAEFRITGVATNIPFMLAVLAQEDFAQGRLSTAFIEDHPGVLTPPQGFDRAGGLLTRLADITVNRPNGQPVTCTDPRDRLPDRPEGAGEAGGVRWRSLLCELGPAGFANALRHRPVPAVTDTTFRDAHQSLLATRVRTRDLAAVGPWVEGLLPGLLSVECWGGATYDVCLRFLGEDPWERLAALREAMPSLCLQMLLRGRNTVGYTPYPTRVTEVFVEQAARMGIDIFRIFDAFNDVERMRPAIDAVRSVGTAVAEVALCYSGDLLDPGEHLYTLDHYLRTAEKAVRAGAHVLAVKDMAGLLRPEAAVRLVRGLRREFDLPVQVHTHDTAGGQLATLLAAVRAGADAVDVAAAPLAGTTSQPSLSALVAALAHTRHDTGLDLDAVCSLEPYWEAVRRLYAPFESGLSSPTGRVYRHEIPGGQLSNLRQQATALGLEDRFEQIEEMYAAADRILGRLIKVTPSSKVVGDLALQLVAVGADPEVFSRRPQGLDLPASVVEFLRGELGTPVGGWPEPFRTRALAGREPSPALPPQALPPQGPRAQSPSALPSRRVVELTADDEAELRVAPRRALNRLLFPGPTGEFLTDRERYGDPTVLHTLDHLYGLRPGVEHTIETGPGERNTVGLEAVGPADERGMRTVWCTLDGRLRLVQVRDRSVVPRTAEVPRADPGDPGQVPAPYAGVVTMTVQVGDRVEAGRPVAVIEAMKMEATLTTPVAGTVAEPSLSGVRQVEAGDLVAVVRPD